MSNGWTQANIANFLGLSHATQKFEIVAAALAVLETSPLLEDQTVFPKLPKRTPRKRDDYKCGNCGMKKRNHSCVGGEETVLWEEDSPSTKKRKKAFKPLTVLILDSYNHQVQQRLDEIKKFGESQIEIELKFGGENNAFCMNVYGSWDDKKDVYLGQLSDSYKEYVRTALNDGTFICAKLAPLQQGALDAGLPQAVWMPQLYVYRSVSWRTKRLSEADYITNPKKKEERDDDEDETISPEEQLAQLHMLIEQQHYVQQIQLLQQQLMQNHTNQLIEQQNNTQLQIEHNNQTMERNHQLMEHSPIETNTRMMETHQSHLSQVLSDRIMEESDITQRRLIVGPSQSEQIQRQLEQLVQMGSSSLQNQLQLLQNHSHISNSLLTSSVLPSTVPLQIQGTPNLSPSTVPLQIQGTPNNLVSQSTHFPQPNFMGNPYQ